MPDTMTTVRTAPNIRVRLQHSHTIREGWRLSETTVEWSGEGDPNWTAIRAELMNAHIHGTREASNRRAIETGDQT